MSLLGKIKSLFCKKSDSIESRNSTPEVAAVTAEVTPVKTESTQAVSETVETNIQTKAAVKPSSDNYIQIPEDSTLKRHFVSNLKCEIEAEMEPRPTDSTLKRHYDSAVQAKLERILSC